MVMQLSLSPQVHHSADAGAFREIAEQRRRDWRGKLVEFNGEGDHIHILLSLPPNFDLQDDKFTADPSRLPQPPRPCLPQGGVLVPVTASFRAAAPRYRSSSNTSSSRRRPE